LLLKYGERAGALHLNARRHPELVSGSSHYMVCHLIGISTFGTGGLYIHLRGTFTTLRESALLVLAA